MTDALEGFLLVGKPKVILERTLRYRGGGWFAATVTTKRGIIPRRDEEEPS